MVPIEAHARSLKIPEGNSLGHADVAVTQPMDRKTPLSHVSPYPTFTGTTVIITKDVDDLDGTP